MNKIICFALIIVSVLFLAFAVCAGENTRSSASVNSKEDNKLPLLQAVEKKYVSFSAKGRSIQSSYIRIQNLTERKLHLVIPAGTFLNANSGSVQNMVFTHPEDIIFGPKQQYSGSVRTACMNIHKNIPGGCNFFGIDQHPDSHLLSKVIKLLNHGNYKYSVIQAAVWIVTDDASYDDTGTLQGQFSGRVISHDDYEKAVSIVNEARKMQ